MTHRALPAVLTLVLFSVQPADAVLTDDEPSNDTIATVGAPQIAPIAAVTTDGGEFALIFGDIDYLAIGNLTAGDIVTVSTTPLGGEALSSPDTVIGLFSDGATKRCEGDDTINNELSNPPTGRGSLCRFEIDSAGTWFVGVTGFSDIPFVESHLESGPYQLLVTINAFVPQSTSTPTTSPTSTPSPTPTGTLDATPTASPSALPTVSPTASPTLLPTSSPTLFPTSTPTATPPLCMDPGSACSNNADCCSNICLGQGPNKTCQAPPTPTSTPTATPTPTPEPGAVLQLFTGGVGLAWLQRRRNRRGRARTRS